MNLAVCIHYFPSLPRGCDAGLHSPQDCHGCPAYLDGTPYLGPDLGDADRVAGWSFVHDQVPVAHFRGNG